VNVIAASHAVLSSCMPSPSVRQPGGPCFLELATKSGDSLEALPSDRPAQQWSAGARCFFRFVLLQVSHCVAPTAQ
jgi:hypothetical protein